MTPSPQSADFHAGTYGFHRPRVNPVIFACGIVFFLVAAAGAALACSLKH